MKTFFLILTLLFSLSSCKSQELNEFEIESRERATKMAEYFMENNVYPYVLFSLANRDYIIVVDEGQIYSEGLLYYDNKGEIIVSSKTQIKKPHKVLSKAFDTKNYHDGFINYSSDFFKDGIDTAQGGTTYFVMSDINQKRYGEAFLSLLVKPNPFDKEIISFFTQKLIDNFVRD